MGHPGLEPEVVLTIQPAVPYPSPKGEVFCPTPKRPSTKGVYKVRRQFPRQRTLLSGTEDKVSRSFSGGYRYFSSVGNPTDRKRLNENTKKSKTICGSEKGYPGIGPGNSLHCVLTIPSGFPRKRKHFSKGFLPAGNPGSPVYDLYMIHIAPSGKSSKDFEMF